MHVPVAVWLALLGVLAVAAGVSTRPMIPVDELRYSAVAWEMWQRGEFLVPYLNGEPYSHKPPLFFWLIHAGWWLFGVHEWVVRAIAPLALPLIFGAGYLLSRTLWPEDRHAARHAGPVLLSCVVIPAFVSWVQIDLWLLLFTMLAMLGIARAWRAAAGGWALCALALAAGILTKGPVIVLVVLPVILLAPLWQAAVPLRGWTAWYGAAAFCLLLAAGMALSWAWPAARAGGPAYADAILWGQTADRVVSSFAHAHPFWWYLPWLAVLLAPWIWLPWAWRYLHDAVQSPDSGMRFCLVWFAAGFVLLSLVSGKQLKYLLPLLPAFVLLMSRALGGAHDTVVRQRPWLLSALLLVLGGCGIVLPHVLEQAPWLNGVSSLWGGLLVLIAVLLSTGAPRPVQTWPLRLALLSVTVVAIGEIGVLRIGAPWYDLHAASERVSAAQQQGRDVAIRGNYHGEFGFYGRLDRPVTELARADVAAWAAQHPDGLLVVVSTGSAPVAAAEFSQPYQGGRLSLLRGSAVLPTGGDDDG